MQFETLRTEKADGVVTLTLSRPERFNAFNVAMALELRRFWEGVKADPEIVCVIVTGAGEKAFCTGADVTEVAASDTEARANETFEESPFGHLTAGWLANQVGVQLAFIAMGAMALFAGLAYAAQLPAFRKALEALSASS